MKSDNAVRDDYFPFRLMSGSELNRIVLQNAFGDSVVECGVKTP